MMFQLALNYEKGPFQLREISKREGLSLKYLSQIILILKNANLVVATRGAQGGYQLARPPRAITALEIFVCLEGEVLALGEQDGQTSQDSVVVEEVWDRLRRGAAAALEGLTLEDLLRSDMKRRHASNYSI